MTPPRFTIREAISEDRSRVAALDAEAREEAMRHRGALHLLDELGTFDDRWASRGARRTLCVAEVGTTIIGWSSVVRGDRLRPLLESVYVTPQARQLGIGAALLREAIARFGASQLDALSLPGDRLTKNLYERGGLKARLIVASAL
jgi:GNAT superfamily N-acetyltransferase